MAVDFFLFLSLFFNSLMRLWNKQASKNRKRREQLITHSIQKLETAKAFLLPLLLTYIHFSRRQQHFITPVFIPQRELASPATPLSPFNSLYLIHCTDGALSMVNLINAAWRKSIFHHRSPVFHPPLRFAHQPVSEAARVAPLQWFQLFNVTIKDMDCRDATREMFQRLILVDLRVWNPSKWMTLEGRTNIHWTEVAEKQNLKYSFWQSLNSSL